MVVMAGIEGLEKTRKDGASVTPDGKRLQDEIVGVEIRRPPTQADERGTICEVYDLRWGFTDDPLVYVYHVTINPGQVKGWVLHRVQERPPLRIRGGAQNRPLRRPDRLPQLRPAERFPPR